MRGMFTRAGSIYQNTAHKFIYRTKSSPIIRRIFLEFEIRTGELQRAKKMLYAAIGECPLAKGTGYIDIMLTTSFTLLTTELYLLAFGPLRTVFNARELDAFADTMAERELRMRKGLDEMLDGWEEETAEKDKHEEDSTDELEYNASELRRLMPY